MIYFRYCNTLLHLIKLVKLLLDIQKKFFIAQTVITVKFNLITKKKAKKSVVYANTAILQIYYFYMKKVFTILQLINLQSFFSIFIIITARLSRIFQCSPNIIQAFTNLGTPSSSTDMFLCGIFSQILCLLWGFTLESH